MSTRPQQELCDQECLYANGREPALLDIVQVPLIEACPKDYQTENCLLDVRSRCRYIGRQGYGDLARYVDRPAQLWLNGWHSANDRVPYDLAKDLPGSLALIHIVDLAMTVRPPYPDNPNADPSVRGIFSHNGFRYRLAITDRDIEARYMPFVGETFTLGEAYLTISLGEPFRGFCYKLIAAVFLPPGRV